MKSNRCVFALLTLESVFLALSAAVAPAADYPTSVLAKNPLAYWRLNETAISPAPNIVANSGTLGSVANGYIVLDVGKGDPGIVGNAIRLNNPGSTAGHNGSKVDVPFNAALNPAPPFSVEFWTKPNSLGGDTTGSCPLSSFNPNWFGGGNRSGYLFYMNNAGRWQFRLGTVGGYAAVLSATSGNATVGTWQHIVATWDGSTANLYVNGVQVGTTPAAVAGWTANTQMALRFSGTGLTGDLSDGPAISATGIAGNRGYDGWLDEVAVYHSVLQPSTIAAHFSAATTNNAGYGAQILADSPVGYWNMNEPAVTEPDPSTLPIAVNGGSLGGEANGTNSWGVVAAQSGPPYAGFGANNKASVFNGESGLIELPDVEALHFNGNITLMAWIKPGVKDFFRDIIAHGWDGSYAETFLRISRNGLLDLNDPLAYGDGTNYYEVGVTDGGSYNDSALFPIPDGDIGQWVFLAGTYDGSKWNLYRNGALVSSFASPNGALDVTNRWSIGSRSSPSSTAPSASSGPDQAFSAEGLFFGGAIDEPAIFNSALSAADINAIYNSAQVPPVITQAPQAPTGTFYSGSSASFSVWAEGSPTLGYLWTSNGISTGVTTTNLNLGNLAAGTANIAVIVTNAYGSATGAVSFVVVGAPPLVLDAPKSITRYTGYPFVFSVVGGGSTPLNYQWQTNSVDIPGATSPSYAGVASSANALSYSCKLSNAFGTSNTPPATLTVLALPAGYPGAVLSNTPAAYWRLGETNGSVAYDYAGGHDGNYYKASLGVPGYSALDSDTAVAFSGVDSYVGDISGTDINFSGHTNFSLEAWVNGIPGASDESTIIAKGAGSSGTTATEQFSLDVVGGNYRFFTRGGGNSLYEADAATGPDGTWQHVVGIYNDTAGQLSIYVNGEMQGTGPTRPAGLRLSAAPVSIGSKHLGNDPAYDGTFNGTVDEVAVYAFALDDGTVKAHYAAAYGSSLQPAIAKGPVSLTNYVSLPAKFSVAAYGSVPLTYQWKKDGSDILGSTGNSFSISSLAPGDAGTYSVAISNSLGGVVSAPATLTVLQPPTSTVLLSALVLHLPFNNSLTDSTGRGNDGTAIHTSVTASNVTTPSFVADGALGQALHYSSDMGSYPGPTTTNNTYVTLGVRPDLQFSSNVNFSIAYWIRLPLNYLGGDLPFFTTTIGSTFGTGLVLAPSYGSGATAANTGTDNGGWAMSIYDAGGNGVGVYGDVGSINDGAWHHLAHVFERGVGATTYLDGVAIPSDAVPLHHSSKQAGTSAAAAGDIDTGSPATIGQDPTGTYQESGSGDIDDFGVWRKALTPLEVAAIYVGAISNGVSFGASAVPVTVTIQTLPGNQIQLTWPSGTLQSADEASGTYLDLTSAHSPYTVTPSGARKFYRVKE